MRKRIAEVPVMVPVPPVTLTGLLCCTLPVPEPGVRIFPKDGRKWHG
jgi:hypothetical protein